jgi:hypothetical protein
MTILMKLTDNNLYEKYIKNRGSDFAKRNILTHFWGHIKGETMYSYGETERQCIFYGETMYFYGKHNLYLNITNF